jgi:polyketide biosynthesis acyl carrier protein
VTPENIFELLVRHTREVIPELEPHAFLPTDSLKTLGANSIDRADIIMMTMEALGVRFPLIELAGAKNLADLVEGFHVRLGR